MKNINSNHFASKVSSDRLIKLFLLFSFYQLILHLYFALSAKDPRLILPTSIAFSHDLALLAIVAAIGYLITSISPIQFKSIANKIFSVTLIITGVLLSAYPKMLREYLVFPVNIFDSDFNSAETLLSDYLGFAALFPCLFAFILGLIVYRTNKELRISKIIKITGFILILLFLGFTMQRPSPQPFIYSLQKKVASIIKGENRVVASLNRTTTEEFTYKANQLEYSKNEISNYSHILLIVLEGITSESFEEGFLTIPNGFYAQHKDKSVYYNNYFASNLDSYTSLIAMLTSVQVPYRAYADASLYDQVNKAPSVTQDLHNRNFKNIFISCYEYQPFVPTRKYWDKIYERQDLPSVKEWVSLGSSKMESAIEDKAAISTIIGIIKSNENSFILHEMVYGHSPEWRATTGRTQNEYHDEYLKELSRKLKNEKLFDKTLFVIVSDHGNRAKSSDIENYRIPLLITGSKISHQTISEWLSHLDLPGIIYHYAAGDKHPESRIDMFFVGSTEKWVYGKMDKNRDNLFIEDASGIILSQSGNLKAIEVRNDFQSYLNTFRINYGINR